MNVLTLLGDSLLGIQKGRPDGDFQSYMSHLFDGYKQLLDRVEGEDPLTTKVLARKDESKELCDRILAAIGSYLQGYPAQAFEELNGTLARVGSVLPELTTDHADENLEALYRIRVARDPEAAFRRRDLFHIPFEKRHEVTTQRFSIPGLPCLYLGGSVYVCWEELARPEFSKVHIARAQPLGSAPRSPACGPQRVYGRGGSLP
jgi:hypothetical protein